MTSLSSPSTQSAIIWPKHFLPGTTDNFVSNEKITKDITAAQIWPLLSTPSKWSSYYKNAANIEGPSSSDAALIKDSTFKFCTFGFPQLTCHVEEYSAPSAGRAGRIAWSAKLDGPPEEAVEIYHAWLVEDLDGGRLRILTQESQIGQPAAELAAERPNKMLLGHQDWVEGLVAAARGQKVEETNLGSVSLEAY